MGEEPIVVVRYALTVKDVLNDELGERKKMPLSEALAVAERLLRGGYYMVKIVKEVRS